MTRHSTPLPLTLFLLVVALSTTNAQRLRGVLKRPLTHKITTDDAVGGSASSLRGDKANDQTKDSELTSSLEMFDELIWQMAAASESNTNEQDSTIEVANDNNDVKHHRNFRWRKRTNIASTNDDGNLETTDSPDGPFGACVGKDAFDFCLNHITSLNSNLNVVILPEGSIVTMDFRTDRVRVYHDNKVVVRAPTIG